MRLVSSGASCFLYFSGPPWKGSETATIGQFEAADRASGVRLLHLAMQATGEQGCKALIGPMDGSTWGNYRFVTWSDGRQPFPLEPSNPAFYPDIFRDAGFAEIASYCSSCDEHPQHSGYRPEVPGIKIEEWDQQRAELDLRRLHELSNQLFASNPLFVGCPWDRFQASYAPVLESLPSRYCLLARDDAGVVQGYLLAYPTRDGQLVIKTVASARRGVGGLLVDEIYRRAVVDQYTAVIHALMHEDNHSVRMSSKARGKVFRRYAVWGRELEA